MDSSAVEPSVRLITQIQLATTLVNYVRLIPQIQLATTLVKFDSRVPNNVPFFSLVGSSRQTLIACERAALAGRVTLRGCTVACLALNQRAGGPSARGRPSAVRVRPCVRRPVNFEASSGVVACLEMQNHVRMRLQAFFSCADYRVQHGARSQFMQERSCEGRGSSTQCPELLSRSNLFRRSLQAELRKRGSDRDRNRSNLFRRVLLGGHPDRMLQFVQGFVGFKMRTDSTLSGTRRCLRSISLHHANMSHGFALTAPTASADRRVVDLVSPCLREHENVCHAIACIYAKRLRSKTPRKFCLAVFCKDRPADVGHAFLSMSRDMDHTFITTSAPHGTCFSQHVP